jgi:tRNA A-37 threonylcarbamoyl transferase component Bud32
MSDPDPLAKLIEGVADGTLERSRLPQTHQDPSISRLLAELQILAGVTDVHRSESSGDESTRPPEAGESALLDARIAAPELLAGASPLGPGDKWGNFELLRKIGEGTFGEVFLARDLWLGHDIALKVLRASIADKAKMLHEARMLVRVRHPHVVTVHGADVHNGRLGFWMDFVDGLTLHDAILRDGRRSAGEAVAWGQDLCRALAAVHAAGIVHRDVKAQNVMRQAGDGRLILMDFGAGEMLDAPRLGEAAGTPLYLAPELLDGAAATRNSDIYALGVLLFYVVAKQFPINAATWDELLQAHERGVRVHLEDVRPDLPASFVSVVERALNRDPSARYASAGEMLAVLRSGSDTGPLHVTPPVPVPTVQKEPPSAAQQAARRVGVVAAGLGVLTFGIGFVACWWFESALLIDPEFRAGPADYLRVGREATWPILLIWVATAATVAGLGGIRNLFGPRLAALQRRLGLPAIESISPLVLAAIVLIAGVTGFVALTLRFYPVFLALDALRTNTVTPTAIALLAPDGTNAAHGAASAVLSFLLGFAAVKWFPRFEQRDPGAPVLRSLKWAALGVAALIVVVSLIPRRIIWDEFEVVQYENQRAFVLGNRGAELLLYVPESPARPWRRVDAGAPGLERSGSRGKLFSKPS